MAIRRVNFAREAHLQSVRCEINTQKPHATKSSEGFVLQHSSIIYARTEAPTHSLAHCFTCRVIRSI